MWRKTVLVMHDQLWLEMLKQRLHEIHDVARIPVFGLWSILYFLCVAHFRGLPIFKESINHGHVGKMLHSVVKA